MRKIIYLFLLNYSINLFYGQDNEIGNPKISNDIIGNFEYNQSNVDLYSGQVLIKIPLIEISEKERKIEIVLDYNASGVKVNSLSNWVGQNWNLNVGGFIRREVRGESQDEYDIPTDKCFNFYNEGLGNISGRKGFFKTFTFLNKTNWDSEANLKFLLKKSAAGDNDLTTGRWRNDYEPDIFYFNFMGHSGYFFLGDDGNWKVSSKSNLKIEFNENNDLIYALDGFQTSFVHHKCPAKTIGRFTLVDDKGFRYVFGDNNIDNIELDFGSFFYQTGDPVFSSAWNIVKVINPNGLVIYSFENFLGNFQPRISPTTVIDYHFPTLKPLTNTSSQPKTYFDSGTDVFDKLYKASGNLILPSYLKKITTQDGSIIHFYSSSTEKFILNENDNSLIKKDSKGLNNLFAEFYAEYLYSDAHGVKQIKDEGYRLRKLDSISVSAFNGIKVRTVKFNYGFDKNRFFLYSLKNNDQVFGFEYNNPTGLPGYLSNKTDLWGYFNNIPYSVGWANQYYFWIDRENYKYSQMPVSVPHIYYGTLKKIIWPTGGSTEYFFEPNHVGKKVNPIDNSLISVNMPVSGLRVKKIISGENISEFFYNSSLDDIDYNIPSGILHYDPILINKLGYGYDVRQEYTYGNNYVFSGSINGLNPHDGFGPIVGYSTVIEKNKDGFIINRFTDYNEFPDINGKLLFNDNLIELKRKTSLSHERGLLKERQIYNSYKKKIKEFVYNYKTNVNTSNALNYDIFTGNWNLDPIKTCLFCTTNASAYKLHYSDKILDFNYIEDIFESGNKVKNLQKFYYKNPLNKSNYLIDKVEEYSQIQDPIRFKYTKYNYATDFENSDAVIKSMIEKNMVGIPLEIIKYNEDGKEISKTKTEYKINANNNFLLPSSISQIKIDKINIDDEISTKLTYDLYDEKENLLQYTNEKGIPISIVFAYNNSLPIAKIEGATYTQVKQYIAEIINKSNSDIDQASEDLLIKALDTFRNNTNLKKFQITTYTYDPLIGVTSITPPSGVREIYKYDTANRLEKVVDINGNILKEYKYHFKQ